jgi:hypothetical protein
MNTKRQPTKPEPPLLDPEEQLDAEEELTAEEMPLAIEERLDEILTNEEIAEIRAEEEKRWAADQKKRRRQAYAEAMREEMRARDGAVPLDEAFLKEMNEPTRVFINLPRLRKATGGEVMPDPIIIDQRRFDSGHYYTVPKAMAIYLAELMDKATRHVRAVDGRSSAYYDDRQGYMVYQGGLAAGGPSSPAFDAIHRRPAGR